MAPTFIHKSIERFLYFGLEGRGLCIIDLQAYYNRCNYCSVIYNKGLVRFAYIITFYN